MVYTYAWDYLHILYCWTIKICVFTVCRWYNSKKFFMSPFNPVSPPQNALYKNSGTLDILPEESCLNRSEQTQQINWVLLGPQYGRAPLSRLCCSRQDRSLHPPRDMDPPGTNPIDWLGQRDPERSACVPTLSLTCGSDTQFSPSTLVCPYLQSRSNYTIF